MTWARAGSLAMLLLAPEATVAATLQAPICDMPTTAGPYRGSTICQSAPQPVTTLTGLSYYTDARHSVADPALRAANRRLEQPAARFVEQVARLSDNWRRSAGSDAVSARCAAAWLDAWAAGGAFSSTANVAGGYRRAWYVSGLGLAWLKIRAAPGIEPAQAAHVEAWLKAQAQLIVRLYADPRRARDARNNHGDWAALAVAAAGVAADDQVLFGWADARFRANLAEVTDEGTLPLEMARARRALHYHLFALTPLALMARFEQANGRRFDTAPLQHLEAFARASLEQPEIVAQRAGAPQELLTSHSDPSELVWAKATDARPGPRLERLLRARASLFDARSGGDVGLTWCTSCGA